MKKVTKRSESIKDFVTVLYSWFLFLQCPFLRSARTSRVLLRI